MKTNRFFSLVMVLIPVVIQAQLSLNFDYSTGKISGAKNQIEEGESVTLTITNLSEVKEFDDFVQNTKIQSADTSEQTLESALKKHFGDDYEAVRDKLTITDFPIDDIIDSPLKPGQKLLMSLKRKSGGNEGLNIKVVEKEVEILVSSGDLPEEMVQWLDNAKINLGKEGDKPLSNFYNMENRYDSENDRAFVFVDPSGNLIGNMPVNIDQDDFIYIIIYGLKEDVENCTVDFIGTYAPNDLQWKTFDAINVQFDANALFKADKYMAKVFMRGPFTSQTVTVKIKNGKKVLASYGLRVNKLFHLAFGVGVNITNLEDPEYELQAINTTTNTIMEKNAGKRTIFSINTIWFWRSTYRYLIKGSNITRGRDVLKEPSFWERINPSFGFSLDSDFAENLFFAANFEFARGGTINIGYHWGKVNRLNIEDFKIGETVFTGTAIPQTQVWDGAFFIGIMLDTRIFNQLFAAR